MWSGHREERETLVNVRAAERKAKVKGKEGSVPPLENIQVWLDASGMIAEATSSASRERGNPRIYDPKKEQVKV